MIGLDSSVVLRLLTGEPEALCAKATDILNEQYALGEKLAVSDLVIAECYFALQKFYGISKADAIAALRAFCESDEIVSLGAAKEALATPRLATAKPGLVDRMIHGEYLEGCKGMVTFEKAGKKLEQVRVL